MPNQTRKDTEIVARIHEGDREVLIDLYKQYEAMISNHVFQNSGNEDDAKDVLQDTLVALWQNVRKPHFELTVQLSPTFSPSPKTPGSNNWTREND